jgi:two-component system chemotaxis response regulator CheB
VAVVLHRSKNGPDYLAALLQNSCPLTVKEAQDKEPLLPGQVLVAPADYHLLVEPGFCVLSTDEPVEWSRPSIDVLFESAADAHGQGVIGVILTGANADGARGVARIRQRGGLVVVQDPQTAEGGMMPEAAIQAGCDAILALSEIPKYLAEKMSATFLAGPHPPSCGKGPVLSNPYRAES